jgi:hypothetical protein
MRVIMFDLLKRTALLSLGMGGAAIILAYLISRFL